MKTWEVIKYLTENQDSDKVFVSDWKNGKKYDIYLDDYTKEFFISEYDTNKEGWIYRTEFKNIELSKILYIDTWR